MSLLVKIDECIEGKYGEAVKAEAVALKAKLDIKFPQPYDMHDLYFESAILEEPEWPVPCHGSEDVVIQFNDKPKIMRSLPVYIAIDPATGEELFFAEADEMFNAYLTLDHENVDDMKFGE
jgi:hypothetical protein